MKWEEILKMKMPFAKYRVDSAWGDLEATLKRYDRGYGLDLNPDFQRCHVWTDNQQIAYVEWILKDGQSGKEIYFNCPDFMGRNDGDSPMVLVDGKQRLQAVRLFLNSKIKAFGYYLKDMECKDIILRTMDLSFSVHINNLKTRKEVLQWYLIMNSGGTDHTSEELEKVKELLNKEG